MIVYSGAVPRKNDLTNTPGFIAFAQTIFDLRSQRESLIASNITNTNTPGYKSVDINFQKALTHALAHGDSEKPANAPVEFATGFPTGLDGNDVSPTVEKLESLQNMSAMGAEIQFLHQSTSDLITALRPNPNGT